MQERIPVGEHPENDIKTSRTQKEAERVENWFPESGTEEEETFHGFPTKDDATEETMRKTQWETEDEQDATHSPARQISNTEETVEAASPKSTLTSESSDEEVQRKSKRVRERPIRYR